MRDPSNSSPSLTYYPSTEHAHISHRPSCRPCRCPCRADRRLYPVEPRWRYPFPLSQRRAQGGHTRHSVSSILLSPLTGRTDKNSAVTWRWDDDHPELMYPRVDGTDLCLSATDETVGAGAQIMLAKCPSLPWEFSYFASQAFRIKIRKLREYRQIVER